MKENYDALDGWREEIGMKNSRGEVKHYSGGSEHDATYEALVAYIKEQKKKEQDELLQK